MKEQLVWPALIRQQMQRPSGDCSVIKNNGSPIEALQRFVEAIRAPLEEAAPCR
jgi:ribose 1,5-bisphosphokinase PhnN